MYNELVQDHENDSDNVGCAAFLSFLSGSLILPNAAEITDLFKQTPLNV